MATTGRDPWQQYEFRINGRLDRRWQSWLDGLDVVEEDDLTTTLRGSLIDQAALHGVLGRLRDLGVTLISMREVAAAQDPPSRPDQRRPRSRAMERREPEVSSAELDQLAPGSPPHPRKGRDGATASPGGSFGDV
jgi:hypothetical protein